MKFKHDSGLVEENYWCKWWNSSRNWSSCTRRSFWSVWCSDKACGECQTTWHHRACSWAWKSFPRIHCPTSKWSIGFFFLDSRWDWCKLFKMLRVLRQQGYLPKDPKPPRHTCKWCTWRVFWERSSRTGSDVSHPFSVSCSSSQSLISSIFVWLKEFRSKILTVEKKGKPSQMILLDKKKSLVRPNMMQFVWDFFLLEKWSLAINRRENKTEKSHQYFPQFCLADFLKHLSLFI